jgi:hypothetical protein
MRQYPTTITRWTQSDDDWIRANFEGMDHRSMANYLGRTISATRHRCSLLKCLRRHDDWSDGHIEILKRWYAEHDGKPLDLNGLIAIIGRDKTAISQKAKALGLSNKNRTRVEKINGRFPSQAPMFETKQDRSAHISESRKRWIKENGHPRGALGMKHTDESKRKIRERSTKWRERLTPEESTGIARKAMMTRIERYGSAGPANVENPYSRSAGGRRADLGNTYFRSSWEANYARYLNWLKDQGQIAGWEYEAEVFVFHGETRGAITYRPDFKVTENDGEIVFHEVKGWMDGPSKTRLRRMKKHYPEVKLIVIGEEEYKAVKKWSGLIPNWETVKKR